jgi:hypothetical protein
MHNDSAMRSRARLNSTIDELWAAVPKAVQIKYQADTADWNAEVSDPSREVSRAEKMAIVLLYMRDLQGQVQCHSPL